MDAEMIEKVARAIHAEDEHGLTWDDSPEAVQAIYRKLAEAAIAALSATPQAAQVPEGYTTGHCEHRRRGPGGCPFPNLQCGYPGCDRRPLAAAQTQGVGRE